MVDLSRQLNILLEGIFVKYGVKIVLLPILKQFTSSYHNGNYISL